MGPVVGSQLIGVYMNPPRHAAVFWVDKRPPFRLWTGCMFCLIDNGDKDNSTNPQCALVYGISTRGFPPERHKQ
jgi:hypothetical protein